MEYLSPREVKAGLDAQKMVILDVREPYELEICAVVSLQIPMADVVRRRNELPKDKTIVVMCRSGKRAAAVAHMLYSEFSMMNVNVLNGGILAWIEEIEPHLESY